jgi:hypothetical protein
MSVDSDFGYFLAEAERILNLITRDEDPSLQSVRQDLENLTGRLRRLVLDPVDSAKAAIEIEFYSLLHKHPKLEKAFFAGVTGEIVNQCVIALNYFSELSKKRPLTPEEATRMSRITQDLRIYQEQYENDSNLEDG